VYDRARPGYPPALFDDLASIAGLGPGADVLEVGCGTGQATRGLVARGWHVTAIEPGPEMAAKVSENLPSALFAVERATFEAWEAGGRSLLAVAKRH